MNGEQLRRALARDTPAWTEQPAPAGDDELREARAKARELGGVFLRLADECDELRAVRDRALMVHAEQYAEIGRLRDQVETEQSRADQAMRAADQYYADLRAARAELDQRISDLQGEFARIDKVRNRQLAQARAERDQLHAQRAAALAKCVEVAQAGFDSNGLREVETLLREASGVETP